MEDHKCIAATANRRATVLKLGKIEKDLELSSKLLMAQPKSFPSSQTSRVPTVLPVSTRTTHPFRGRLAYPYSAALTWNGLALSGSQGSPALVSALEKCS